MVLFALASSCSSAKPEVPYFRNVSSPLNGTGRVWAATRFEDKFYFGGQITSSTLVPTPPTLPSGSTSTIVAAYDSSLSGAGAWSVLGGAHFIAINGTANILQMCVDASGNVYVVGVFQTLYINDGATTIDTRNLARYDRDTNTWAGYGDGMYPANSVGRGVVADDNYVYVVGGTLPMTSINNVSVPNIARITLGNPQNARISACSAVPAGQFTAGATLYNFGGTIYAAALYVGLNMLTKEPDEITNGTTWTNIGLGANGPGGGNHVIGMDRDASGNIIAGGATTVWYYNAATTSWSILGDQNTAGNIGLGSFYCVAFGPDGTRYAAGTGTNTVRVWTGGVTWTTMVTANSYVKTMQFYKGRIYFGGVFNIFNGRAALRVAAYY